MYHISLIKYSFCSLCLWHLFHSKLLKRKKTFILKKHDLISGVNVLSSVSLLAGSVGDVTNAGTGTGQRKRKRDEIWGDYIAPWWWQWEVCFSIQHFNSYCIYYIVKCFNSGTKCSSVWLFPGWRMNFKTQKLAIYKT